jgi:hypothetical protein
VAVGSRWDVAAVFDIEQDESGVDDGDEQSDGDAIEEDDAEDEIA